MPRRTTDFRGLSEPSRFLLLELVQKKPGLMASELAEYVGLHLNTTREHLDSLVHEGLLAAVPLATGKRGRPPLLYGPVNDPALNKAAESRIEQAKSTRELLRKLLPPHQPQDEIDLDDDADLQLEVIYEHFADTGFQPEINKQEMEFRLVPCPYFKIVEDEPSRACAVHEKLIKDTLSQVPGPVKLVSLQPFIGENECRVRFQSEQNPAHS